MHTTIDVEEFLAVVTPALREAEPSRLARQVHSRWSPKQLCLLLRHKNPDVRKVAAIVVGLVGCTAVAGCLAVALRDPDEQVGRMAEYGLWSIWLRSGSPQATPSFKRGMALLADEKYHQAAEHLHEASRIDPDFAEAYNQCAIAHYFMGQWKKSIADSREALARVPYHFGAVAGMGHCYAQLGDLPRAKKYYKRALEIYPHNDAIRHAIARLDQRIHDDPGASGEFLVDSIRA